MSICITKISTPSMARVKERLNNNAITKNFIDVVVQIILTLILFSKVTNYFNPNLIFIDVALGHHIILLPLKTTYLRRKKR